MARITTTSAKRARGQLSRQIVMETAVALFNQQGYDRTSMNDVAHACGITKAGLYHYFASKEDMLAAGIAAAATVLDAHRLAAHAASDPPDPLGTFILAYGRALRDPVFRCLVLADDRSVSGPSRTAIRTCKRRHQQELEALLDAAGLSGPDARALSLVVFGAFNWTAASFGDALDRELERVIHTLIALVNRSLRD